MDSAPAWEPGDQVMCRTALGDEVIGTATSGIIMGRDMQVVWIDFGDRHLLPWPVDAIRAPERFKAKEDPDVGDGTFLRQAVEHLEQRHGQASS